jgi:hypothetical protein
MPERAARLPRTELPDWVVRLYALVNREMRGNLGELGLERPIDARAAEALLGRPFVPPREAVLATARSLVEQHLV